MHPRLMIDFLNWILSVIRFEIIVMELGFIVTM